MKLNLHRLLMCTGSVALAIGLLTLALGIGQGAGILTRITTFTGTATERRSEFPDLSADGAKIAFHSYSDFLGEGITSTHIWLYDTTTMTFTRITTDNFHYYPFDMSADGKKIAFANRVKTIAINCGKNTPFIPHASRFVQVNFAFFIVIPLVYLKRLGQNS